MTSTHPRAEDPATKTANLAKNLSPAERIVPLHLTRPMSTAMSETATSRSVRVPFRVPSRTHRWRVIVRNANYRANTINPGAVTILMVGVGHAAKSPAGLLTGAFGPSSEAFPNGFRSSRYQAVIPNMGETEWSSEWFKNTLHPQEDYLLTYGYRTDGNIVHRGIGGGWWTTGAPLNAGLRHDPSAVRTKRLPLDVRIEVSIDDAVPVRVVLGDSIAAGSSSTLPIYEAPSLLAARMGATHWPVLHTFGGATLTEWVGGWGSPNSMKWLDVNRYRPQQQAVIALGSNDIHAGKNLSSIKASYLQLIEHARNRISTDILACTVTPRRSWAQHETTKETTRRALNAWLAELPDGLTACIDTAGAVTAPTSNSHPRADVVAPDGIHFNSRGSSHLARAFMRTSFRDV